MKKILILLCLLPNITLANQDFDKNCIKYKEIKRDPMGILCEWRTVACSKTGNTGIGTFTFNCNINQSQKERTIQMQ